MTYTDPETRLRRPDRGGGARSRHGAFRILRWPFAENDRAQAERSHRRPCEGDRHQAAASILGCAIAGGAGRRPDRAVGTRHRRRASRSRTSPGSCSPIRRCPEVTKRAAVEFLRPVRREPVAAARHRLRGGGSAEARHDATASSSERGRSRPAIERSGLSARLLVLTMLFVMLAEVLIYVPSVANFRRNWLNDRLAAAQVAALVLDAAPDESLPAGARGAAARRGRAREADRRSAAAARAASLRRATCRREVAKTVDLREASWTTLIRDAFEALLRPAEQPIRVVGTGMGRRFRRDRPRSAAAARRDARILPQHPAALPGHLGHHRELRLFRAPMGHRAAGAAPDWQHRRFRERSRGRLPGYRADAIAPTRSALAEQAPGADGDDARGRVAPEAASRRARPRGQQDQPRTAQHADDRAAPDRPARAASPIEAVQRVAPRLVATLERAIAFCEATLAYGRAAERLPRAPR